MSNSTNSYQRFPFPRRIEHLVMLLTFTTLALTGLPQKFSAAKISIAFIGLLGGIENLRTIHHVAAILLMLGTIWHLLVFGYLSYVRRVRLSMLPSLQDLKDGVQALLYNLGFAKSFPQMGRYTFEEKLEYWAFVWGTVVMVITGFMMWNPLSTAKFFPGEVIPAAKAAHGGEATLAVLAIIVWHMYGVHVKRFNKSMWTGKMSEEEMLHEHPLELADIKAGIAERPVEPVTLRKRQQMYLPIAAVIAILLVGGVYGFVNAEQTALATINRQEPTIQIYVPQTLTPAPTQTPTLPPTETPLPTQTPIASTPATAVSASTLSWDNAIGAMLQAKCGACHGSSATAGLNLSTYADAITGGNSGVAIIPGDSDNSLLVIKQLAGGHFGQLSADELATVIEWIKAGASEK
jgi:cytochrome b subunit of formate dehydrogenase/mono/diheme cytochrome c family protein